MLSFIAERCVGDAPSMAQAIEEKLRLAAVCSGKMRKDNEFLCGHLFVECLGGEVRVVVSFHVVSCLNVHVHGMYVDFRDKKKS